MHKSRHVVIIVVAVLVALALAWGFYPGPVPVDTAVVDRGRLRVTVEEEGKTRVVDRYVVSAPVTGYLKRITLDAGDPVSAGGVVTAIEPSRSPALDPRSRAEARERVRAAEARLSSAKEEAGAARADAEYFEAELERVRELYEDDFVPKERLDRATADHDRASARLRSAGFAVEVARYELEAARTSLRYAGEGTSGEDVRVASPVDGRVLKVYRESEGPVTEGAELIEVGDPSALEVEVELLSEDSVRVAPGTPVEFTRWGGGEILTGRVKRVEPSGFTEISALGVEEQRVLVISDITSPRREWSRLGDAYRVEASFIVWEGEDVLRAPTSALFRHRGGWAVFVVEGGRAVRKAVEVGHRSGLTAEVTEGLSAGDVVITHPDESIDDGARVEPRERRPR